MVLDKFLSGDTQGVIDGLKRAEGAGIESGMLSDPLSGGGNVNHPILHPEILALMAL